ncbi:MAG: aldehyde dehydrogenase family protein [Acidobacteria bacterium]|nr:MAG: aldehyde dehydrogenase family protein [Acidobacteriota bacterium]REK01905.1 MAG: aldehyde dehydrogenase family protein [Acidobacteriota bacterium]REK14861.1 MAG: aldehyde dehydrogenase family protein [Acidobacteriota bacterium]REK45576.1 MAG: aldehyde dehydrogenase family protein [Acidobacteriota bacterium]
MTEKDPVSQQEAREAVEGAHLAFLELSRFDQDRIDSICDAMAEAAARESLRLGQLAHDETGFGIAEDKREKNRFAAEDVWNYFRDLKTVGVVKEEGDVVEIAAPRGVVAAIIPSTNPTSTAIFKIIIAIKSRNSIVLSPHPSAARCIAETARVMKEAGSRAGLPENAVKCLENGTIDGTETLMKHKQTAVILATGGIGLVRAAYSSGKPAFGVGPGNVPVYVESSADLAKAASDILTGTCFDNGTICASEQSVVVDSAVAPQLRKEFEAGGAYFLSNAEADKVASVLLTEKRTLNAGIVGKSAAYIAELAGISIPGGTRCLIADCAGVGRDYPWSIEKLSPTLAFFEVEGVTEAASRCDEILRFGGMGHTAGMHTSDRAKAVRYGEQMPAARIVINSPTTHGAIGFSTDLPPSMTLGCGSWGGNVTSDNVSPHHLMDIKRVAFETRPVSLSRPGAVKAPQAAGKSRPKPDRAEITSIVDQFLKSKLSSPPEQSPNPAPLEQEPPKQAVVHSVAEKAAPGGSRGTPVDFVSEDDVKDALAKGAKIYVNGRTIITPSARDLGEQHEIFSRV